MNENIIKEEIKFLDGFLIKYKNNIEDLRSLLEESKRFKLEFSIKSLRSNKKKYIYIFEEDNFITFGNDFIYDVYLESELELEGCFLKENKHFEIKFKKGKIEVTNINIPDNKFQKIMNREDKNKEIYYIIKDNKEEKVLELFNKNRLKIFHFPLTFYISPYNYKFNLLLYKEIKEEQNKKKEVDTILFISIEKDKDVKWIIFNLNRDLSSPIYIIDSMNDINLSFKKDFLDKEKDIYILEKNRVKESIKCDLYYPIYYFCDINKHKINPLFNYSLLILNKGEFERYV